MSCGAIAAPGLHPAIAFICYGAVLIVVIMAAVARAPLVTDRLATIAAVAALSAALGMLLAGRAEVAPLALAAFLPLAVVGLILQRGTALERAGIPLLALALLVAVADRQVFAPGTIGPDVLLAVTVAAIAAPLAFASGRWRPAVYALVLGAYALTAWIVIGAQPYRTDAVATTHGAAELLLAGRHAYADFDMFERLERFGIPRAFATDLEDGTSLRSMNYPALAFLIPAPLVAAGLADVRLLYLGEVVALLAVVTLSAREPWRPYVLAAGIGGIAVMRQFVVAGVDPAWALFLVAAWLTRETRGSALLLGLAISARQTAWPVAPFLLVWSWRRHGPREATACAALAGGLALALHAPFLVTAPGAVIGGITDVVLRPILPGGVGPGFLAAAGLLPELPRAVYFALAAAAFGVLMRAYVRGPALPRSTLALPLTPFFLTWRALQSYFALAPLLLLVEEGSPEET